MRSSIIIQIVLLALLAITKCPGQNEQTNVMSYYAVGNSLDGQPMVDMQNVLRFFPVFAMRDGVDTVRVTVYYGSHIYTRKADAMEGGQYWQILLPKFSLGEAIQRLEVEVHFAIPSQFKTPYNEVIRMDSVTKISAQQVKILIDNSESRINRAYRSFRLSKTEEFGRAMKSSNDGFARYRINSGMANELRDEFEKGPQKLDTLVDTLSIKSGTLLRSEKDTIVARNSLRQLIIDRSDILDDYNRSYAEFGSIRSNLLSSVDSADRARNEKEAAYSKFKDSVFVALFKFIETGLADSMYSGPSVRKSDLIIDSDFQAARILYRNYKSSLRYMPALDPAERMGIFRARYVPFPIVGTNVNARMNLKRPFTSGSPTVFEIGLAFGDAIVPGDEFVVPEFSWRRLGVAFAITEKLFSDSAEVIGLALTYDFNSYGSIGIGGNFAGKAAHGYASLGINEKAFEAVIGGLAKFFK